jgi:CCDC81-like prokaryotic HU domain 1/CCDC81-like prokaryotic HU domain 2/SPOR domain
MASVNDYLKKLLYQYDCVVVPELGAFLTHYQPASFTESSGLFLPPRKRVAFNEALRLDDGILANYIMLHEPVTREGAQRYISQFVSTLRQQVTSTDRFEIDGIGTFTANEEGKLQFDPSLRHNFYGESYGMSAVSAQSLTMQALEATVVAPESMAVGPVLVQDDDVTLMPVPRSRPYWRIAAAAMLVGSLGLVSYFSVLKPGQPQQSSLDPGNLLRVPATFYKRSSTRPTETARPVIPPAQAAAVETAPTTPSPQPVAVVSTPNPVADVAAIPTVKATPVIPKSPSVIAVAKPTRTTTYFTVIAGSFSSKRNALRLTRQLHKAGYADAFVIMPTRRGQLYKVAAVGSDKREEAIAGVTPISAIAGTEAWIFKN